MINNKNFLVGLFNAMYDDLPMPKRKKKQAKIIQKEIKNFLLTVELMHKYIKEEGYEIEITDERMYHEIYISYLRKCDQSKLKTVIRHPIRKL